MLTILCIATYFKGEAYLRECRRLGCTVLLLTAESLAGAEWPRESIDELHTIPRDASDADIRRRVDADRAEAPHRSHRRARRLRRRDGAPCSASTCSCRASAAPSPSGFRDKLAMRVKARAMGLRVPEFSPVFNDQELHEFTGRVRRPVGAEAAIVRRRDRHQEGRRTATSCGARSKPRATSGRTACSSSS